VRVLLNQQDRFRKKLQKAYHQKDCRTEKKLALLEIEPTLGKIQGDRFLPALRINMENFNMENKEANLA
jgi:hypothetical protein